MVSGRGFVCSLWAQSTLLCLHAKVDVGRWRARTTPFCDDLQMFTVDSTAVSLLNAPNSPTSAFLDLYPQIEQETPKLYTPSSIRSFSKNAYHRRRQGGALQGSWPGVSTPPYPSIGCFLTAIQVHHRRVRGVMFRVRYRVGRGYLQQPKADCERKGGGTTTED